MIKKISLIFFVFITFTIKVSAQVLQDTTINATIPAKFMNDDTGEKFQQFMKSVIKYPETKKRLNGRVYAQFIIDSIGNLTEIKIIKSLRSDYDQSLIDALNQSPKWTPAMLNNKPVSFQLIYPIAFSK
jgi:hypothetical protein